MSQKEQDVVIQPNINQDINPESFPEFYKPLSRISTDIDFDKEGKQVSFIRVPHSRNDSAWGSIFIPIVVYKNGSGPTILLTGGIHGDEYEGPIALNLLTRTLKPEQIQGRVIILPAVNLPAIMNDSRLSPIDNLDLNRSFPGDREGSPTLAIAHYLDKVLLPLTDIVIDLHSGGKSLDFVPSIAMHKLSDRKQHNATFEALMAFGAPYGFIHSEVDGDGTFDTTAENKGDVFLFSELRGGGRVSIEGVQVARNGLRNILEHFEIACFPKLKAPHWNAKKTQMILDTSHSDCYVRALTEGIYEPFFELGQHVKKGKSIGRIHFIQNLKRKPVTIQAQHSGIIVAKRALGWVSPGDCLAVIGNEIKG
ncbi:MAG: succinylglutamate desuccinylase/aspartoacylase family protein [Bacteriovoracaceae bacterium]|jgi:N-alpha-acetyl-L-2,4-diaminobutyrate deacetylase|nr:hypothetical protein [Halobacteriovoraceae bacterium]MDP7319434.1 succinylglutamate desuccinylase/aspartoacylase family protein [Bacteriovoracaceae bacterium]